MATTEPASTAAADALRQPKRQRSSPADPTPTPSDQSSEDGAGTTSGPSPSSEGSDGAGAAGAAGAPAAAPKPTGKRGGKPKLPDRAVSILKAWLLSPEHFDYPYPTDSDKLELTKKCNITPKQLTNWFTNARKRLWLPMRKQGGHAVIPYGQARVARRLNSASTLQQRIAEGHAAVAGTNTTSGRAEAAPQAAWAERSSGAALGGSDGEGSSPTGQDPPVTFEVLEQKRMKLAEEKRTLKLRLVWLEQQEEEVAQAQWAIAQRHPDTQTFASTAATAGAAASVSPSPAAASTPPTSTQPVALALPSTAPVNSPGAVPGAGGLPVPVPIPAAFGLPAGSVVGGLTPALGPQAPLGAMAATPAAFFPHTPAAAAAAAAAAGALPSFVPDRTLMATAPQYLPSPAVYGLPHAAAAVPSSTTAAIASAAGAAGAAANTVSVAQLSYPSFPTAAMAPHGVTLTPAGPWPFPGIMLPSNVPGAVPIPQAFAPPTSAPPA